MENRVFYIALGDSLTAGVGASAHERSFAASFFQSIKQTKECRYMNFGKSGRSSGELLQFLTDSQIRDLLKRATHITITTGGIDLIRAYENNVHLLGYISTIQTLKQNLQHILHTITETNRNTHIFLMGLYNPGTPDHKLYQLANQFIQRINQVYEETAKDFNVHAINPIDSFLNKPYLLADEVHPNDLGYKVIADLFLSKQKLSVST
ncbi:lysophospholipase L1-like esterase [Anoxybacillus vitaminiphilus]|uniref:Lysophospholipase L1-like esterase n=1 Tax=Paranoxybacillus vitaminiphilus TaxID=581036 RepID=A0A327YL83_9BACL|nr:GDSL-type esterase/lipase family protein [Anoxybacillus vitaminiphilus]RAK21172.1 lysophospholipase L1-like esterase [Anoxybacillus vitaminiphilus]